MDISKKMRGLISLLHRGVNEIALSNVKAECENEWGQDYAIVNGVYWDDQGRYFDKSHFIYDLEQFIKNHFSGPKDVVVVLHESTEPKNATLPHNTVVVRLLLSSQELEVYRIKGKSTQ